MASHYYFMQIHLQIFQHFLYIQWTNIFTIILVRFLFVFKKIYRIIFVWNISIHNTCIAVKDNISCDVLCNGIISRKINVFSKSANHNTVTTIVSKETAENAFTSHHSTIIFSNSYCLAISVTSLYMLYAHSKGLQS